MILVLQVKDNLQNYSDLLFSSQSPIFIAVLVLFVLLVIVHTFYQFIFRPLREKHYHEKQEAELKNAKILALFSEHNPDPTLRIDGKGKIIASNQSAVKILQFKNNKGTNISDLFDDLDINYTNTIASNGKHKFTKRLNERTFDINLHGMKDLGFAQVYFHDITEREEFTNQLTEYQQQVSNLVNKLETQLEFERDRISKDLHDSICQTITIANMHVRQLESGKTEDIKKSDLSQIEIMLSKSVKEIRSIINNFKPIDLQELGLEKSIKVLIEKNTKNSDVNGRLNFSEIPDKLDDQIEICIFRVIQEAVANIIKHAKTKNFNIDINSDENIINLIIADDGVGFKPKKMKNGKFVSSGNGVVNIQERVIFAGGELEIDSIPGSGTVLIITLPLKKSKK